jgi:tetratricopeptide (TPR) repeat protein
MVHDIGREPLALFLQQVYLKNFSGHLAVTGPDFQISLYFLDGKLVNGQSTRFDEKISVILHLMGTIDEEQYNFLGGLHQFPDDQVGEILVDHHFAKKKDIFYARIYQLRRMAISLFSLQKGKWSFSAGSEKPPGMELVEIPLAGILVEGARSIDHISFYANRWLLHVSLPAQAIPPQVEVYFTAPELDFFVKLAAEGPGRTCQELIARLNIFPVDFWRKILVFHLLGLLQFQKSGGHVDIGRDIATLLEMNQFIQSTPGDVLCLLRLPPDASAESLENARNEFLRRFSPERFGSAAAPEIKNIARSVCQWLLTAAAGGRSAPVPTGEPPPAEIPAPAPAEAEGSVFLSGQKPGQSFSPAAAPSSPSVTDDAHQKAWAMLLHGKELYEKQDFDTAISLLRQAIKLEPGQGDFYYLLGLCQSEIEVLQHEAELNLKKAIELRSWSADPVYALGVLYRGQGKAKLAERCFQRVKEISYEHTGASRALVDLRRQKAGGKVKTPLLKRKIF